MEEHRRMEEQRRMDVYHPSEAAHHPPAHNMPGQLPPMQAPPQLNEPERAARKMDIDEEYDDSGDEKKAIVSGPASGPGSSSGDMKTTPTGMMNGVPKVE